jgi:hypothetical protein
MKKSNSINRIKCKWSLSALTSPYGRGKDPIDVPLAFTSGRNSPQPQKSLKNLNLLSANDTTNTLPNRSSSPAVERMIANVKNRSSNKREALKSNNSAKDTLATKLWVSKSWTSNVCDSSGGSTIWKEKYPDDVADEESQSNSGRTTTKNQVETVLKSTPIFILRKPSKNNQNNNSVKLENDEHKMFGVLPVAWTYYFKKIIGTNDDVATGLLDEPSSIDVEGALSIGKMSDSKQKFIISFLEVFVRL